uniref:Uncharacterized protein n=1 Tax=Anguilla anguilla TaxID=7936 RepID=A0A0E9R450_ANGAN
MILSDFFSPIFFSVRVFFPGSFSICGDFPHLFFSPNLHFH